MLHFCFHAGTSSTLGSPVPALRILALDFHRQPFFPFPSSDFRHSPDGHCELQCVLNDLPGSIKGSMKMNQTMRRANGVPLAAVCGAGSLAERVMLRREACGTDRHGDLGQLLADAVLHDAPQVQRVIRLVGDSGPPFPHWLQLLRLLIDRQRLLVKLSTNE